MTSQDADLSKLKIDRSNKPRQTGFRISPTWIIISILLAAAVYFVYSYLSGITAVTIEIDTVQLLSGSDAITTGISANGYVVARTKASVSSKISGRLESLTITEGSFIQKNEIIATLENKDYMAAVQQAKANLGVVQSTLLEAKVELKRAVKEQNRVDELHTDGFATGQQKDNAFFLVESLTARIRSLEAQILSVKAAVRLANVNLDNTYIRAPFDGVVLRKDAEMGEIVAPAVAGGGLTRGAVVTMADLSTLEVEADVNEAYISQIITDQNAEIILDAFPTEKFRGKVRQIIPTADRQKATVQVKVSILDSDKRIMPEMGAKVTFLDKQTGSNDIKPHKDQIVVGDAAVRVDGSQRYVWKVLESQVFRQNIIPGELNGSRRIIKSGLSPGETVAVSGFENLIQGTKIKLIER